MSDTIIFNFHFSFTHDEYVTPSANISFPFFEYIKCSLSTVYLVSLSGWLGTIKLKRTQKFINIGKFTVNVHSYRVAFGLLSHGHLDTCLAKFDLNAIIVADFFLIDSRISFVRINNNFFLNCYYKYLIPLSRSFVSRVK